MNRLEYKKVMKSGYLKKNTQTTILIRTIDDLSSYNINGKNI